MFVYISKLKKSPNHGNQRENFLIIIFIKEISNRNLKNFFRQKVEMNLELNHKNSL